MSKLNQKLENILINLSTFIIRTKLKIENSLNKIFQYFLLNLFILDIYC